MFKWLKDWGEEVKQKFYPVVPGYFGGGWYTAGYLTNPVLGTILADTGPLPAGIYDIRYFGTVDGSTGPAFWALQHRNAANTTDIFAQYYGVTANTGLVQHLGLLKVKDNESVRIIVRVNMTTSTQHCLYCVRVFPLIRGQ